MAREEPDQICEQAVGCGQKEAAAMGVYIPLFIIYTCFLIFIIVVFSLILKQPAHRSCRAILLLITLVIYSCLSIMYCCGIFIEYSTKLYTSVQMIRSLIFMAALLVSISSGNKLAWQLKFTYRARSAKTATLVTDIFLIVMYGGICAYFFITLLDVNFEIDKLQMNHLYAAFFFIIIALVFALVKIWVYISVRYSYQHLYAIFREKMLRSSVIITIALVLRAIYDFTIYFVYDKFTESQSKYFDLILMIVCEVMPLGAGSLSMLFSLRHSQSAISHPLNRTLSAQISPSHRDSYQSSKKYAHEIASRLTNYNPVESLLTEQEQISSVQMQHPTSSSIRKDIFDRQNEPVSGP